MGMECLDCSDVIPASRIQVIPNATRCRDCQGKQEAGGPLLTTYVSFNVLANTGLTAIAAGVPLCGDQYEVAKEIREYDKFVNPE